MGCGKSKPANVASGNTVVAKKKTIFDMPVGEKSVQENAGKVGASSSSTSSTSSDDQPVNQTVVEAEAAAAEPEKAVEAKEDVDSEFVAAADQAVAEENGGEDVAEKIEEIEAVAEPVVPEAPMVVEKAANEPIVEEKPVEGAKPEIAIPVSEEAVTATESAQPEAATSATATDEAAAVESK